MTKPLAITADAERVIIDYLTAQLAARGVDATVGVDVPSTWEPGTKAHAQIALDGTPSVEYPVLARASIRVTCWHASTTMAKSLANLAMGLLCSHAGSDTIHSIQPLTGPLVTRDPATIAQLASIAVRVNLKFTNL